jgi:hypothetical protein
MSQSSRWGRFVISAGPRGRYVGTILFFMLVLLVWYVGVYRAVALFLQKRSARICTQRGFVNQSVCDHQNMLHTKKLLQEHMARGDTLTSIRLSHDQQLETYVSTIFSVLTHAGIILLSYSAHNAVVQGDYAVHAVHVALTASLQKIGDFCTQLSRANIPLINIQLNCTKDEKHLYKACFDISIVTHVFSSKKGPLNLEQAEGLGG